MKLTIKDYIILGLLILFVFSGVFYSSGIKVLKKENKELKATIKANDKVIDNLSVDISRIKTEIAQEIYVADSLKIALSVLKKKNQFITRKYEKIISDYNSLSDDAKWQYFRSAINQ